MENARILAPLRKYLELFMEPSDYQTLPEAFQARRIEHLLCVILKVHLAPSCVSGVELVAQCSMGPQCQGLNRIAVVRR